MSAAFEAWFPSFFCHFPLDGGWLLVKVGRPQWKLGFPPHRRFLTLGFSLQEEKVPSVCSRFNRMHRKGKQESIAGMSGGLMNVCSCTDFLQTNNPSESVLSPVLSPLQQHLQTQTEPVHTEDVLFNEFFSSNT